IRRSRSSSMDDDVEYLFWHALVRDVAYSQIPRGQRARKHVAAAEWIQRVSGDRITDHAEFLAHHYRAALELARAAGDTEHEPALLEAAIRFCALAAERALLLDHSQAERYYRQTLAILPEGDPRRPRLLADAADAGTTAGRDFDQIRPELEEAIAAMRAQGDTVGAANAMRQLSFLFSLRGERAEVRQALPEEARSLLEEEPPGRELA